MGSPGRGIDGAKNDLRYSLDRLADLNYVVEDTSWRHILEGNIDTKSNLKQSTSRKNN
jgi:hypothetical protein